MFRNSPINKSIRTMRLGWRKQHLPPVNWNALFVGLNERFIKISHRSLGVGLGGVHCSGFILVHHSNAGFSGAPWFRFVSLFLRVAERCRKSVPSPYRSRNALTKFVRWVRGLTCYFLKTQNAVHSAYWKLWSSVICPHIDTVAMT